MFNNLRRSNLGRATGLLRHSAAGLSKSGQNRFENGWKTMTFSSRNRKKFPRIKNQIKSQACSRCGAGKRALPLAKSRLMITDFCCATAAVLIGPKSNSRDPVGWLVF